MSRIRVVFGIGGLHGGGAERQMITVLQHLDRSLFQPFLYLVYRTGPLVREVPEDVPVVAFDERWQGARWPGVFMHGRRVADMKAYLAEVQADVCYDRTFLMTLIAAEAAQALNVPNVSTVVTEPGHAFPLLAGRFQNMKRRMLRRLYSNSTNVLANSNGAARAAEQFYGLTSDSIETIYNAIDLERIDRLSAVPVAHAWRVAESTRPVFRIVTAGRLTTQKGFDLLIDAVAEIQKERPAVELRLAILGEGVDRDNFQAKINHHDLQTQVVMPGFMENAVAWYHEADLLVLPSLFEGFPNVLMEAMSCGTSVLSSDCPFGPAELLEKGRWGQLCEVGSLMDLKRGMLRYIDQPGCAESMAEDAKRHVRETFGVSEIMSKLQRVLIEAADR
ncbi:MAG: glycosyltransferase [Fuerstiella sp.]